MFKKYKYTYSTIILFFLVFGIKFSFFPISLSKLSLLLLFVEFMLTRGIFKTKNIPKSFLVFIAIFFVIGVYSVIVTAFKGINDFDFFNKMLYLIYEPVIGGFILSSVLISKYEFKEIDFFIILRNIGIIQSILTILAYLVPSVNVLYDAIIPNTGNLTIDQSLRVRGFTNLGGAWLSVMLAFSVVSGLRLIETSDKIKSKLFNVLCILVCILATIATGRTGLILSLAAVAVYLTKWVFTGGFVKNFGAFFICTFGLTLITFFAIPNINDVVSDETMDWAFEIFLSQDAGYSTASTDELNSMLYLPGDPSDLMFGSGFYESGNWKYRRSDSGLIKTIFSIGILGAVFFYGTYVVIALQTIFKFKNYSKDIFHLIVIFSMVFIVEVKEPYLQTIGVPMIIFTLYFIKRSIFYQIALND